MASDKDSWVLKGQSKRGDLLYLTSPLYFFFNLEGSTCFVMYLKIHILQRTSLSSGLSACPMVHSEHNCQLIFPEAQFPSHATSGPKPFEVACH